MMTLTDTGLAPTLIYIQQQVRPLSLRAKRRRLTYASKPNPLASLVCGEAFLRSATLSSLGIREGSVLLQLVQRVQTAMDVPPKVCSVAPQTMADQSPLESVPPPARVAAPMPPMKNDNGESFSLIFPSQAATQAPSNSSTSPFGEPFSIFGARPAKSVFGEPERQQPKQPKVWLPFISLPLGLVTLTSALFLHFIMRFFLFLLLPLPLFLLILPLLLNPPFLLLPPPPLLFLPFLFFYSFSSTALSFLTLIFYLLETEGAQQDCTPCDREAIIYRRVVPQSTDVEISDDVPDEFFELTEGELRRILARLREEAGTDAPLGASSLHQTTRARFYARYPRCILRFTWPDDVLLQACFRPGERVSALYDFIKDFLIPTAGDFQLYTTPPKVNIPNNSTTTLAEANLVPMTKIHLTLPSGPPRAVDVVRPEFLASMTPESATADEIAIKWITCASTRVISAAAHADCLWCSVDVRLTMACFIPVTVTPADHP
ncbi:unnamed protein product [Schistocephalus solidus]|uniref:UBX domain-containing protein n=1 Tax=Schistocephalus solidus TaxID=70667 RepID=A0A3P7CRF8_SCHSO|nr:unnamed protein product [Schistocephalus solidus]